VAGAMWLRFHCVVLAPSLPSHRGELHPILPIKWKGGGWRRLVVAYVVTACSKLNGQLFLDEIESSRILRRT